MPDYRVRPATLADAAVLVRHRIGMFTDMGLTFDAAPLRAAFHAWLIDAMGSGVYRAWLAETGDRIVGGAGITVIPWPPGPRYSGDRLAYVYNVYTEPDHRRRGVARQVMEAIHAWCAANGVTSVALNASAHGRTMYETMGYTVSPSPMMFRALTPATE